MGIHTEYQSVIICDSCGNNYVNAYMSQKDAITKARRDGWSIGKKVTCPECKESVQAFKES